MAILWMVPWLMIIFMFCDVPRDDAEQEENSSKCGKMKNIQKYTVSWMDMFLREETVLILTVFFVIGFSGKVWEVSGTKDNVGGLPHTRTHTHARTHTCARTHTRTHTTCTHTHNLHTHAHACTHARTHTHTLTHS